MNKNADPSKNKKRLRKEDTKSETIPSDSEDDEIEIIDSNSSKKPTSPKQKQTDKSINAENPNKKRKIEQIVQIVDESSEDEVECITNTNSTQKTQKFAIPDNEEDDDVEEIAGTALSSQKKHLALMRAKDIPIWHKKGSIFEFIFGIPEIVSCILSYLPLRNYFYVMRVSRDLYHAVCESDVIWTKIWKEYLDDICTLNSVKIPDETEHARIMYEKCRTVFPRTCFICHRKMVDTQNYHFRVPICKKCVRNREFFAPKTAISTEQPWFNDEIIKYCPCEVKRNPHKKHSEMRIFCKKQVEIVMARWKKPKEFFILNHKPQPLENSPEQFFETIDEYQEFKEQYLEAKKKQN